MDRRRFVVAVMGGAIAAPKFLLAQQATVHRVVWLSQISKDAGAVFLAPFIEGMAALGYFEPKNLSLDARYGNNSREVLERESLVAAALQPAVFVTQGPAIHAARKIAGATPVIFAFSGDPVELGVAQSLARPGGRFTGVTFLSYDLSGKRVELLREILPRIKRLAILSNPHHVGDKKEFEATRAAATRFGLDVSHHPAGNPAQVGLALAQIAAARAEAVLIHPDGLIVQERETIARFSIQHRIPTISGWAAIAEGGSLMTYGPNLSESYRRLAYFTDRILRGTAPADLPIELPSVLELVVNLRTAKALGLTVPQSLLLRADRVIE